MSVAENYVDRAKIEKLIAENGVLGDMSLSQAYQSIRRIIRRIPKNPNGALYGDPKFEPLFKTVKMDTGQYERIISEQGNTEYQYAFPAVFIRFINVRYLVDQNRTNEGRAQMRIRYILDNVNNQDDDMEIEPFEVFHRINNAIQDARDYEKSLSERCNLMYWDMPQSCEELQPFWIDYELYFREDESYQYRNWIRKYIIFPQFTNYSDSPHFNKPDVTEPTWEEVSGFYAPPLLQWGYYNIVGLWNPEGLWRDE